VPRLTLEFLIFTMGFCILIFDLCCPLIDDLRWTMNNKLL
jgi:hypothetical protein